MGGSCMIEFIIDKIGFVDILLWKIWGFGGVLLFFKNLYLLKV